MKMKLCIGIFLLAATCLHAQTNDLTALLQQGLFEEQASRNLDAAIADYSSLAAQFDKNRQLAATAIFRLGECYRAQGRTNEAATQYQRIVHEFSDQQTLATLSRQDLAGMGMAGPQTPAVESAAIESSDIQLWSQVKDMPMDELARVLPTLVPDASLDTLLQQRNEAQAKLAQIRTDYSISNNVYMRQKALVNEINRQTDDKIVGIKEALKLRAELPHPRFQQRLQSVIKQNPQGSTDSAAATTDDEDREIVRIQQMIQNSPDLINAPSQGTTPLVTAAYNGWLKVTAYLLDHGADVNIPAPDVRWTSELSGRVTPLMAASGAGNKAMTKFLIDRAADINFKGQYGDTPLHLAAKKGFQAVTEVLLASHADVNAQNNSGTTPLFSAVQGGQLKIVQMLLAAGANANLKDSHGQMGLNYAVGTSPEIYKSLLDASTNPNTEDSDGRTPLSYAVESDGPNVVKLLLAAKADPNSGKLDAPLLWAIQKKDVESTGLLLQAGANPNTESKIDETIARSVKNFSQTTPLFLAITMNQLPMVQLLLKYKADPNDTQTDGHPLIFNALSDTNILESLLNAGAKIEAHDATADINGVRPNWTALAAAAWEQKAAAVEILLNHGANPNFRDTAGNIPLHWAINLWRTPQTDTYKMVQLLLDHGTDPNQRNSDGRTPLDLIKMRSSGNGDSPGRAMAGKIVDLLRQHNALDKLPDWDCITVSRPAANFSFAIFRKGTNDYNQFTLLEMILNFYESSQTYEVPQGNNTWSGYQLHSMLPFPDLTHIAIVRPIHGSTNETCIVVNLLNETNDIDCAKDVPLEFGDVVEVPERNHSLGENAVGLTENQRATLENYVKGKVQLTAHGQQVELSFYRLENRSTTDVLLSQPEAQKILTSSSDLSQVKVIRRDPKTGEQHEWILDCRTVKDDYSTMNNFASRLRATANRGPNEKSFPPANALWLRDGDVIEVPEKP